MNAKGVRALLGVTLKNWHPSTSVRVMAAHEHDRRIVKLPAAYVINTDPVYETGDHWVGLYITKDRVGYFFDSYGRSPKRMGKGCWAKLIRDNTDRWCHNSRQVQPYNNAECGYYVCKFLLGMAKGENFKNIIRHMTVPEMIRFKRSMQRFL